VHERYRRQTTDRQTDGRAIAYSEREREFTFAKNCTASPGPQIRRPFFQIPGSATGCVVLVSVRPACSAAADAGQVSAGLRVHPPRRDIPHPQLHRHPARLFGGHVEHQEHQVHVHHLPAHGKLKRRRAQTRVSCNVSDRQRDLCLSCDLH